MNIYKIEGSEYESRNEYDAVKTAYKMAARIYFSRYLGSNTWEYIAVFACGHATVIVQRVG